MKLLQHSCRFEISHVPSCFDSRLLYVGLLFVLSITWVLSNPSLPEFVKNSFNENYFLPYYDFTNTLFEHNTSYLSESLLWPIVARSLGLHHSALAFVLFNVYLIAAIIPVLGLCALTVFKSYSKSALFVCLWMLAFRYLHDYEVGLPDPITIFFLCLLPFIPRHAKRLIFCCVFFAGLSHFSLAVVAVLVWVLFSFIASGAEEITDCWRTLAYGFLAAKLFIAVWMVFWGYQVSEGRLMWVINHGLDYFLRRFKTDPSGFWLTPGIGFFVVFSLLNFFNIFLQRYRFFLGAILSMAIIYMVHFFTIDGLRIFSVAVSLVLIEMIVMSLQVLRWRIKLIV